jgi:hypothetical protein
LVFNNDSSGHWCSFTPIKNAGPGRARAILLSGIAAGETAGDLLDESLDENPKRRTFGVY